MNQAEIPVEPVEDDKYIVFKRSEFYQMMGELALPPWVDDQGNQIGNNVDCAVLAKKIMEKAEATSLEDAVVIRRRDVFAPPALDAYANSITAAIQAAQVAFAGYEPPANILKLQDIADYFHHQATIAWDTVRTLPD